MNIAIEYVLRDQKIRNLLKFPCTLFLQNAGENRKLIVALDEDKNDYRRSEHVQVTHYAPQAGSIHDNLPPCKKFSIDKKDIFSSQEVIVPKYKMIEFTEEPYSTPEKQFSEMPHAAVQEQTYNDTLKKFFNPKSLRRQRENWLWECFEKKHVPDKISKEVNQPELQREYVLKYHKSIWGVWGWWKRMLLEFEGPAAELVFANAYKSEFLNINKKKTYEDFIYSGGSYPINY